MKLATVNPELNFDVDMIISKDVSEGHGTGAYGPSINSSHTFPNRSFHGTLAGMPSASSQFPPWPQALGLAYLHLGRFTAAIKSNGHAIELDDIMVFALVESGNISMTLGSFSKVHFANH
ncbi:hypothetical protein JHK84_047979 [Glycine max]|nr:hypothetical protein JHK86_047952 [Glycine max]KAG4943915.1 hypothetical protein JHK85_048561 [Glycine max]KAG5103010.1 hypothetical protein JHK84_047979 [Glycine max]